MGRVYRARDTKLNRLVAIKFLSDELADPAARRRFQREAQMASSLNHPHILTVHDVGEFEGRQYLVTEFVDGGTLKDWAGAEKRSWRQIVELLVGVADGLATAHVAGILHRDIKPANILVTSNGYGRLADFGLAKLEERTSPEAVTQTLGPETTGPGIVVGTVAYMSPEQASGKPLTPAAMFFLSASFSTSCSRDAGRSRVQRIWRSGRRLDAGPELHESGADRRESYTPGEYRATWKPAIRHRHPCDDRAGSDPAWTTSA